MRRQAEKERRAAILFVDNWP